MLTFNEHNSKIIGLTVFGKEYKVKVNHEEMLKLLHWDNMGWDKKIYWYLRKRGRIEELIKPFAKVR